MSLHVKPTFRMFYSGELVIRNSLRGASLSSGSTPMGDPASSPGMCGGGTDLGYRFVAEWMLLVQGNYSTPKTVANPPSMEGSVSSEGILYVAPPPPEENIKAEALCIGFSVRKYSVKGASLCNGCAKTNSVLFCTKKASCQLFFSPVFLQRCETLESNLTAYMDPRPPKSGHA